MAVIEKNRLAQWRALIIVGVVLAIIAAVMVAPAAHAAEEAPKKLIVGPNDEIYGTQEAADLAAQARTFDPMYCPVGQADRDQAVLFYEKAITAQPGAKLNAPLASRIAELYALHVDPQKKIKPDYGQARQWWNRCLELTSSKQFLWAEAQMGLASTGVVGRDFRGALEHYNNILEMDISQVELPDWQVWPDGNSERGQAALERERARLRESMEGIQARAAEKQIYVLEHVSKPAAYEALQTMTSRFKGTAAGDKALSQMTEIRKKSRNDPWALPNLAATTMPQAVVSSPLPKAMPVEAPPPIMAEAAGENPWRLRIAMLATVGAVLVGVRMVWIGRRKRLIHERGTR